MNNKRGAYSLLTLPRSTLYEQCGIVSSSKEDKKLSLDDILEVGVFDPNIVPWVILHDSDFDSVNYVLCKRIPFKAYVDFIDRVDKIVTSGQESLYSLWDKEFIDTMRHKAHSPRPRRERISKKQYQILGRLYSRATKKYMSLLKVEVDA